MNEHQINEKLKSAVNNTVPDVLGSVLQQCEYSQGKVIRMTETKKSKNLFIKIASVAAAFAILAAAAIGTVYYRQNNFVASRISLDVNPSVEIDINKNEKVLKVSPLNDDGKKIVGDMDFKGTTLEVAVNALIGSMLKEGYIDELSNSILISVDNDDKQKGEELKRKLSELINQRLSDEKFEGAVLSQTVTNDKVEKVAKENGISKGKAQLINSILKLNKKYTFEELAKLSINELNILAKSGEKISETVEHKGSASEKKYIGVNKAKVSALKHAGLSEDAITGFIAELDYDDGIMVYEIEFNANGVEYEYDINAVNGEVVNFENDSADVPVQAPEDGNTSTENTERISEDEAKLKALSHAGVKADDIRDYSIKLDEYEVVYEIEFKSGGYEYSYEINAESGKIIDSEKEKDDDYEPDSSAKAELISKSEAKSKALSHAGVKADDIRDYSIELDDDEAVYEIEFKSGAYEYSYEINAKSGKVIGSEKEKDDDYKLESSAAAELISKSEAKSKALSHAGVKADDIRDYSIELDDVEAVYEIEFKSGAYEYSYEISAKSGKVIGSEKEKDDDYIPESSAATELISKSKAKSKALSHAGLSADDIIDYSIELDDDEAVYEIEFKSGAYEYSYEIDAQSGKIIDSEKEKDD